MIKCFLHFFSCGNLNKTFMKRTYLHFSSAIVSTASLFTITEHNILSSKLMKNTRHLKAKDLRNTKTLWKLFSYPRNSSHRGNNGSDNDTFNIVIKIVWNWHITTDAIDKDNTSYNASIDQDCNHHFKQAVIEQIFFQRKARKQPANTHSPERAKCN